MGGEDVVAAREDADGGGDDNRRWLLQRRTALSWRIVEAGRLSAEGRVVVVGGGSSLAGGPLVGRTT